MDKRLGVSMDSRGLPTEAKDMFCYGIYTASHMVNRAYTPHLKRLGLTYPQYITLTLLWERDGQRVSELADALRMGTNTLTPLLKRLERQGLVSRVKGIEDAREVFVYLTPKGWAVQKEAPNITACIVEETTLEHGELEKLQEILLNLCAGLAGKP